jgi:excisionase family DNA binding protein
MTRMDQVQGTTEVRKPGAQLPVSNLVEIHEVAEVLCVTPRHIRRLVAERRIPYLKIGRFVRFDRAELSVWLDNRRIQPQDSPYGPRMSSSVGHNESGGPDVLELIEGLRERSPHSDPASAGASEQ